MKMNEEDILKLHNFFGQRKCHGMKNMGNTCYLATVIQCIGHCISIVYPIIANQQNNAPITNALRDIYKQIWVSQENGSPRILLEHMQTKIGDRMNLFEQNDCLEFMMLMIDCIMTEIGVPCVKKHIKTDSVGQDKLFDCMEVGWNNSHSPYSYLCDILYGQLVNQVKCKLCGDIEHQSDIFGSISLQIDTLASKNITEMMHAYFEQEIVHRNCDNCKLSNVSALRVSRVWRTPQVLVVHLKRFDHLNMKIKTKIIVEPILELTNVVLTSKKVVKYELKSIACHGGSSCHSGHYFAATKNPNATWSLMDDDVTQPIQSFAEIPSEMYYVLFYELC
jgi:ubiquitin carboxyl-terminal hydrolase 36/42